jgi:predicted Fe-S protein YdhL (DUF1289 family)
MSSETKRFLLEKASGIALADFVPSPCISVCRIDAASGTCEGCYRTLDEIARWSAASEDEKRAIWNDLLQRAQAEP